MSHIFIAHVEEDADIALSIALGLEEAGYRTWCYEVDSVVGTSYILRTGEAVAESEAVAVIISPNSLSSSQVSKEIVRAHESGKDFLPILRGISHVEFQQRQPEWREAIGSATSINVPEEGVTALVPLVIEGIKSLGIKPNLRVNTSRVNRVKRALDKVYARSTMAEDKVDIKTEQKKSKKPLFITLASIVVIAIIVVVFILNRGGIDGEQDQDLPLALDNPTATTSPTNTITTTTSPTPPITTTTSPTTTPTTATSTTPATSPAATSPAPTMPDLIIQNISWSPENPTMGDEVTFTVTFTNIGKSNAASSHVAYYIDGVFQDTESVYSINSGDTTEESFKWEAELGTHTIKAVADFNDTVAESNETNNEKEITFSEALDLDLIILDVTWSPANPVPVDGVTFYVVVLNQGQGETNTTFYTQFYVDGVYEGVGETDGISAGESVTVIMTWKEYNTLYTKGIRNIKFVVDYSDKIPESDDTNNSKTITISVS